VTVDAGWRVDEGVSSMLVSVACRAASASEAFSTSNFILLDDGHLQIAGKAVIRAERVSILHWR
jgi:hypothetical protein